MKMIGWKYYNMNFSLCAGSSIFLKNAFFIVFEKTCLKLEPVSFAEAVKLVFTIYWCMNIQYPPGLSNFLGFVER